MDGENNTPQVPNSSPVVNTPPAQDRHISLGPVLGVLLIMLVLVAVGLYVWGSTLLKQTEQAEPRIIENNEPETPRAQADIDIYGTVSPSTELDAIEADVMSTNLDLIDQDINTVDQEVNATLGQ